MEVKAYSQSDKIRQFTSSDVKILRDLETRRKISDVTVSGDAIRFRARQFIGTIGLSQLAIQIVPAVEAGQPMSAYLFHMLDKIYESKFRPPMIESSLSALLKDSDNVIEIIAALLIGRLGLIGQDGLDREYIECRDVERFLRGRMLVVEQVRHACCKPEFHCIYDELTEDNLNNQIIAYAIHKLVATVSNSGLRKRLFEFRSMFSDVSWRKASDVDFENLSYSRLNEHYRSVHGLCKLIIENLGVENALGSSRATSFLIDGNVLFEEFVVARLDGALREATIKYQFTTGLLTAVRHQEEVTMRADIVIYSNRKKIPLLVIDTKFQNVYTVNQFGEHKLRTSHFYQLLSYASRLECPGLLVYPGGPATIPNHLLEWKSMGLAPTKLALTTIDMSRRDDLGTDLANVVLNIIGKLL